MSIDKVSFNTLQLVDLVRQIEQLNAQPWAQDIQQAAPTIETELANTKASFTHKAIARAKQLAGLSGAASAYKSFVKGNHRLVVLVYALMGALGFYAVLQTLASSEGEINVYWLLIMLLGLNLVSMLLWLALCWQQASPQSPILQGYKKLLQTFSGRASKSALFAAWSESHLFGSCGKWLSSQYLHFAWLCYLAGGLTALLITLSGKQYNFVWGTTILSPQAFVSLTETLAVAPMAFGFSVPDQATILASVQGANAEPMAALRGIWASFIVGCVLIYALLPRFILYLWSVVKLKIARKQYQPDWELPYFYALRTQLLPQSQSLGVVDSDQYPEAAITANSWSEGSGIASLNSVNLPERAYTAAYEWAGPMPSSLPVSNPTELGVINDAHAQTGMLQALKQTPMPVVMIVDLQRAADRGAARFFKQVRTTADLYLVVVRSAPNNNDAARWAGWQATAERISLNAENLYLVSSV